MFKRLSVIAAVFFLLTAFVSPALAGTLYDETKAIDDALQNYGGYYKPFSSHVPGQDQSLHYITDSSLSKIPDANGYGCGFLTYCQPHENQKDGQYRYIGYTFYGEDYTNMDFPPDRYANGADFASQNWVSHLWDDPAVKASNPNIKKFDPVGLPGDGDSDIGYRYILQYSIGFTDFLGNNGYKVDLSSNPSFWDNIHLYVHVLSPATTYSWGIGRMWHKDANGNLWYITIPIAPSILIPPPGNLKAVSIDLGVPAGQKAEPGAEYTATVVFENESDQAYSGTPVAILHNGYQATLYDENGQVLLKKTISGKEVQVADFGLDPNPGTPNQPTNGIITVQNDSEKAFTATRTVWRVRYSDGTILDENTIVTDLAPGEVKALPFSFVPNSADTYSVAAMINPDHDNPPYEVNWLNGDWPGDNRMEASYPVEEPCTDISVVSPYFYPSGTRYVGHNTEVGATVARANGGPAGPVDVTVTASGPDLYQTKTISLGRGESQKVAYIVTVNQSGQATYTFQAEPVDIVDCSPGNNSASVTFNVKEMQGREPAESSKIWPELTGSK